MIMIRYRLKIGLKFERSILAIGEVRKSEHNQHVQVSHFVSQEVSLEARLYGNRLFCLSIGNIVANDTCKCAKEPFLITIDVLLPRKRKTDSLCQFWVISHSSLIQSRAGILSLDMIIVAAIDRL